MIQRALRHGLILALVTGLALGCSRGESQANGAVNGAPAAGGAGADGEAAVAPPDSASPELMASVKVTELDAGVGSYLTPGTPVRVGTGPVSMAFSFPVAMDAEAVRDHLTVSGASAQPRLSWAGGDLLILEFPAGGDGEEVLVTLTQGLPLPGGGRTAADLVYGFQRTRAAGVTLLLDGQPDRWPATGRTYLPVSGEVKLELAFDKPVDRESVDAALQADSARGRVKALTAWEGSGRVLVTMSGSPGSELRLSLDGARDRDGVALSLPVPHLTLRWGPLTAFYAAGLGGGDGSPLLTVPHAVPGAVAAVGGKRLAYLEETGQPGSYRVWISDARGTARWDTNLSVAGVQRLAWLGDGRLLVADETGLWLADAGERKTTRLSPGPVDGLAGSADGRLAAWLQTRGAPDGGLIYDVHYRETSQGATGMQAEVLRRPGPPGGRLPLVPLALCRNAATLAVGDTSAPVPGMVLLTTDGTETRELPLPETAGQGPLAFSPGGELLLAGPTVIDTLSGIAVADLPDAAQAAWAPGSNRLAYSTGTDPGASEVAVLDLGSGERRNLGKGVLVGWLSDSQVLVLRP